MLDFSLGAEYLLAPEWTVGGDLRIFDHGRDKIDGVTMPETVNEAYLAPGGTWRPKELPVVFQGAVLLGLTDDSYDYGLLIGARF